MALPGGFAAKSRKALLNLLDELAKEFEAQLCVVEGLSLGLLVPDSVEDSLPLLEFLFCEPQMRL